MRFASGRKEEARLRGLVFFFWSGERGKNFRAHRISRALLLLGSFLLALLFRLSHVGSPVDRLVRGRSIRTLIKKTSKRACSVILARIDASDASLE